MSDEEIQGTLAFIYKALCRGIEKGGDYVDLQLTQAEATILQAAIEIAGGM